MKDIYWQGKIYQGVAQGASRYDYPSIEVIGEHNFQDMEDVTGRYEVRYQVFPTMQNEWVTITQMKIWSCTVPSNRRIVAIPLHKEETPAHQEDVKKGRYIVGLKGYGKSAKPIYSDTPLIPAHQTGAIVCPFCNEEGFDKIGLKHHLQYYCNEYATITNL